MRKENKDPNTNMLPKSPKSHGNDQKNLPLTQKRKKKTYYNFFGPDIITYFTLEKLGCFLLSLKELKLISKYF